MLNCVSSVLIVSILRNERAGYRTPVRSKVMMGKSSSSALETNQTLLQWAAAVFLTMVKAAEGDVENFIPSGGEF